MLSSIHEKNKTKNDKTNYKLGKYVQILCPIKDFQLEYIKNLKLNNRK